MNEQGERMGELSEAFEASRRHLRGVAFRMLGSLAEAEDAVQEAWIRFHRADTHDVQNLKGWLTTVVARVSLDMLRARSSRREDPMGTVVPEVLVTGPFAAAPEAEQEVELADSVGLALLVVLETLAPAERLAFVLHDLFGMPFEEVAQIVDRTPAATRQLASRARRRVQGSRASPDADLTAQREIVDAFLVALRGGDFEALVRLLAPDVVVHADAASAGGKAREIRGAETWARGAIAFSRSVPGARPALVDGAPGLILAAHGRVLRALRFTIDAGKIAEVEAIGDAERVQRLEIAVL